MLDLFCQRARLTQRRQVTLRFRECGAQRTQLHRQRKCLLLDGVVQIARDAFAFVPSGAFATMLGGGAYAAPLGDWILVGGNFDDGDALDVLVLQQSPVHPLTIVTARPIGVIPDLQISGEVAGFQR